MKRLFLKELGLSNEIINKVMAENGRDIQAVRSQKMEEVVRMKAVKRLLADLMEIMTMFSDLNVERLKKDAMQWEERCEAELTNVKKDKFIDMSILQACGKSPEVIKGMLDKGKIMLKEDGSLEELYLVAMKKNIHIFSL